MPWSPPRRQPVALPGPWPICAEGLLQEGASWLHSGSLRPGDSGGDLLVLPGGPRLDARWESGRWRCNLDGRDLPGSPWEALETAIQANPFPWVGAASFEVCCDEAGLPRQPLPGGTLGLSWRGARRALRVVDGRAELWFWDGPSVAPDFPSPHPPFRPPGRSMGSLAPLWSRARHREAVGEIQRLIRDGEFYVANLCVPFEGPFSGDPAAFALAALRQAQPPYGAFLPAGNEHLLCLSMERLLARRGDRIWTEPIKGSAPLAGDPAMDGAAGKALQEDPKERSEHTMVVDLMRNDLGRVAATGTVQVESLMALEPYPTVQHLVSRVAARLRPDVSLPELLRAVLPGGSVTGTPKRAVCGHLAAIEAGPRGFYCGALGWVHPSGDVDLCLPIRTAHLAEGRIHYWTGGGITRRSLPEREWEELFLKTRVLEGLVDLRGPGQ